MFGPCLVKGSENANDARHSWLHRAAPGGGGVLKTVPVVVQPCQHLCRKCALNNNAGRGHVKASASTPWQARETSTNNPEP
jgi:hypothetical protein